MCVLSLTARHANRLFSASYYIVIRGRSVLSLPIFPHYLINGTISEKKWVWNCVFAFSEKFHFKKNSPIYKSK